MSNVGLEKKLNLIKEKYISVRYKFIEYKSDFTHPVTISYQNNGRKLTDNDLRRHLRKDTGVTIGVFPRTNVTKFIGLDIDTHDIAILIKAYEILLKYGVSKDAILMSFSGNKGYHLDIFLNEWTNKDYINQFYKILVNDLKADLGLNHIDIELYGGNDKGYKLPLGYHQKTGQYCYTCDQFGRPTTPDLDEITGVNPEIIQNIIKINYKALKQNNKASALREDIEHTTKELSTYQSRTNFIKHIENVLDKGIHTKGNRNNTIFKIAIYFKSFRELSETETKKEITNWIETKWSNQAIDKEAYNHVKRATESVYKNDYRLPSNKDIYINDAEIELIIDTVKGKDRQQTESLRQLAFILTRHQKAYGVNDGKFYMSKGQMVDAGATKNKTRLNQQLKKLEDLGYIKLIKRGYNWGYKNIASEYKVLSQTKSKKTKTFELCHRNCKECFRNAVNCLLDKDQQKSKQVYYYFKQNQCKKTAVS